IERLAEYSPPELEAPPVDIRCNSVGTLPRQALELGQPGGGGCDALGRFPPAVTVEQNLLDVLTQVEKQRRYQWRRRDRGPPEIGRQVADQQAAHGIGKTIGRGPPGPQGHQFRASAHFARHLAPDIDAGGYLRGIAASFGYQEQRPR